MTTLIIAAAIIAATIVVFLAIAGASTHGANGIDE